MDKDLFESLSYPYQARILRFAIEDLNGSTKDFSKQNIDDFINLTNLSNGKKIIKDDLELSKSYKSYDLRKTRSESSSDEKIYLSLGEEKSFNGYRISADLVDKAKDKAKTIGYFDYDKLNFPLEIRTRKNGDKFKPLGFGHSKKLKDFFIDEKIDRKDRNKIPLLFINNKLTWIVGKRRSEDFKVKYEDTNILMVSVEELWKLI